MIEIEIIESPDTEFLGIYQTFRSRFSVGTKGILPIADPKLNPIHIQLELDKKGIRVSSVNPGSFFHLNNKKIAGKKQVQIGDLIKIGNTSFKILNFQFLPRVEHRELLKLQYQKITHDSPDIAMLLAQLEKELLRLQALENIS